MRSIEDLFKEEGECNTDTVHAPRSHVRSCRLQQIPRSNHQESRADSGFWIGESICKGGSI